IAPDKLRALPEVSKRVAKVKEHRLNSDRATTRELARFPVLFGEIRQPDAPYLIIPRVSSERRSFIPVALQLGQIVASNLCLVVPHAGHFHLGVVASSMHMAWMRYTSGRLKSDYRYSAGIVYNNFPWPRDPSEKQVTAIEEAARNVLDARSKFSSATLADLYDTVSMPPELVKAHQTLDRAVDASYACPEPGRKGKKDFKSDAERVAFLFELYQQYTSLLPLEKPKKRRERS
ncbi:MAG: type IIL restriction-modification enzyme MmeI, partial [Gammaproteobacteria bacterium]